MWECGLKRLSRPSCWRLYVTPYVGVWIETYLTIGVYVALTVTPYVGVWIETGTYICERVGHRVTPYVGVWIETLQTYPHRDGYASHSLCGSVD